MLQGFRQTGAAALLAVAILAGPAHADVQLPNVFGNSMVLQQGQANRVWGRAEPGEAVTVSIDTQNHKATAGDDGNWHVMLESLKVGGPYTLTVQGKNKIQFNDVLVGEVWLGSGQSNMQWAVRQSDNADAEIASATCPQIRLFYVPRKTSAVPVEDVEARWVVCSPESIGEFSAVLYYFGRELHQDTKVPMGRGMSWR